MIFFFRGNSSRHSRLARLVTDTAAGGNLSLKSCPLTSQSVTAITVTSLSLSSPHLVRVVVCGMLHIYVLFFSFSSSPPFLLLLLSVLDEKASPGAPEDDGKLSVGPV